MRESIKTTGAFSPGIASWLPKLAHADPVPVARSKAKAVMWVKRPVRILPVKANAVPRMTRPLGARIKRFFTQLKGQPPCQP